MQLFFFKDKGMINTKPTRLDHYLGEERQGRVRNTETDEVLGDLPGLGLGVESWILLRSTSLYRIVLYSRLLWYIKHILHIRHIYMCVCVCVHIYGGHVFIDFREKRERGRDRDTPMGCLADYTLTWGGTWDPSSPLGGGGVQAPTH